jgi:hypothetical protein
MDRDMLGEVLLVMKQAQLFINIIYKSLVYAISNKKILKLHEYISRWRASK